MKLEDLIIAVKEDRLQKDQLESYHKSMSEVFADMQIEMAELEKQEALFMAKDFGEKKSVADRKVLWKATKEGQRLIVLKRYTIATSRLLNSLKSRLYSQY